MIVTLSPCVTPIIASNWCVVVRSNHPETLPPNDDKCPLEPYLDDLTLGYQTSNSTSSSKFRHLALLVALVLH